jgi:hypothetical protein
MAMKPVSRSASLPEHVDERLRAIAQRENRTIGNVVESAVRVFTAMPRELRDLLVEISMDETSGSERMQECGRQAMYAAARARFFEAAREAGGQIAAAPAAIELDDAKIVSSRL